jgi:uncharacterized protein YceH (UPF0502 family)
MGETADGLPPPSDLTAVEGRVVGCLIEKERATPQNYPLTLNSLRLACNQSTNRDPVVDYDDHEVEAALTSLRERGLTRIVYSTSNRAAKYRHVLDEQLRVNDAELAALCVLLLRGPQTLGEIKGRSERLHAFGDLGEVEATLDALAGRETGALVRRLERRPGQKDARYIQLLTASSAGTTHDDHAWAGDTPDAPVRPATPAPAPAASWDDEAPPAAPVTTPADAAPAAALVDELRREIERLGTELATLRNEFDAFRSAFE